MNTQNDSSRAGVYIYSLVLFLVVAIGVTIYVQSQMPTTTKIAERLEVEHLAAVVASVVQTDEDEVVEDPAPEVFDEAFSQYIEVVDSCGPHYEGECLQVRATPATSSRSVAQLRTGIVLKVSEKVTADGLDWYKITFDEWLRYPERVSDSWYVAADYVSLINDQGLLTTDTDPVNASSTKRIVVDRSEQRLYAYEGDELFMSEAISTGIELTPTPRGTFTVFKKTPTRYMQGPLQYLAMSKYYDLPGVPWNLYFTQQGAVIHGAYWHDSFGSAYSSGCVNLSPIHARILYEWAELGTSVTVQD